MLAVSRTSRVERVQAPGVGVGLCDGLASLVVGHPAPVVEQRLEEAELAGRRRAQLVGHDADELLAVALMAASRSCSRRAARKARQQREEGEPAADQRDADEEEQGGAERAGDAALELLGALAEGGAPADALDVGRGRHHGPVTVEAGGRVA